MRSIYRLVRSLIDEEKNGNLLGSRNTRSLSKAMVSAAEVKSHSGEQKNTKGTPEGMDTVMSMRLESSALSSRPYMSFVSRTVAQHQATASRY